MGALTGDIPRKLRQAIDEKGARWASLPRTSLTEQDEAETYYEEEIMPLLVEMFTLQERNRPEIQGKFKYLILPLGTSYPPLVFSIIATCPVKVFILHTTKSESLIDKVVKFTGLTATQLEKRQVDAQDPVAIYQAIKEIYAAWGHPNQVAIDFTGGTKAMSGGSAMAGAVVGAELLYIASSNYRFDLRRPYPGSEYLELIQNPYTVFGDLEEKRAFNLLATNDFATARHIFGELAGVVPDPRRYQVLEAIISAYEAWDNFDLKEAMQEINRAQRLVEQLGRLNKTIPLADQTSRDILNWQAKAIGLLSEKLDTGQQPGLDFLCDGLAVKALMFSLYHNALRREQQGKCDMAVLLLYRLLELISQHRLALRKIDTAKPDYETALREFPDLLKLYCCHSANVKKERFSLDQLPMPISLFQGYVILKAMGDPVTAILDLQQLNGRIAARNNSVFAHGFHFLSTKGYHDFRMMVEQLLRQCLQIEGDDFDQVAARYQFINLAEYCQYEQG